MHELKIIRHGLWYKTVSHGRAFGNGIVEQQFSRALLINHSADRRLSRKGWNDFCWLLRAIRPLVLAKECHRSCQLHGPRGISQPSFKVRKQ